MNKIWQIEGQPSENIYTDSELIAMIKNGQLDGEAILINASLNDKVKLKDTIYSYYLKENY